MIYVAFAHVARPPLPLQLAVFTPIAAMARLLGYKVPYPYSRLRGDGSRTSTAARRQGTATNPGPARGGEARETWRGTRIDPAMRAERLIVGGHD